MGLSGSRSMTVTSYCKYSSNRLLLAYRTSSAERLYTIQGNCIVMFDGGWKYTFGQINSRRACSCSRAMVHLPQAQDQTGALDLDFRHGPSNPHPFHEANGEVVLEGLRITDDADRV